MTVITISAASRALLEAHVQPGRSLGAPRAEFPDGRVEIDVDEDVHASLEAIDPDPDTAIRVLCTIGVGRA